MAWGRLLLIVSIVKKCQARDVSTTCSVPNVKRMNFFNSIAVLSTNNHTLSCEIHSNTPLKEAPIWRYENSSRFPAYIKHSVESTSCSTSPNTTCKVSNLTLINVIRGEYDGNYSLTVENDCGAATVYVYVNIMVLPNCRSNHSIPPQLKTHPPRIVETVEGDKNVVITAQYEGVKDDPNLGVYWCVYFTQHNYYCYNLTEDDGNFVVTTDGCPPYDSKCCYFTVILTIRSLTLDLSGIFLQSMVIWKYDPESFVKSNSTLVVNVRPTLEKWSNDHCIELNEGQSTEFTCIYHASTNPNITITTWRFNEELLEQNLSHHTVVTKYGIDPIHRKSVLSRLVLSNVIPNNNGTYTCQCVYNSTVIASHKDNVVSRAASFCLEVNPGKKQESFIMKHLIIIGVVVALVLFILFTSVLMFCCRWRRHKKLEALPDLDRIPDERRPLLSSNKQMLNFAGGSSTSSQHKQQSGKISNSSSRDRSRSISPYDDISPTNQVENKDELISGQDTHSSLKGLIPSHQRPYRQPGDMVTGATNTFSSATAEETHEQLPVPAENSYPISTSLESFDRTQSGNNCTNQPATSECCVQGIEYGSDKAIHSSKPVIPTLSTMEPIECEAEGPRTSIPAAIVQPSVSEPIVPHSAERNTVFAERSSVEVSNYHDRILNLIAPEFTTHVNMESLLPFLQQHQLLTRDEIHHLSSMLYSSSEKAQKLLGYLKTKGGDSLQRVLCCLKLAHEHTGHKEVADKLKQLMQDCSIKCTDFCTNCRQSC